MPADHGRGHGIGGDIAANGGVEMVDDYFVQNMPAGMPLTFNAELVVGAQVGSGCGYSVAGGTLAARLLEGTSNDASISDFADVECDEYGYCCGFGAAINTTLSVKIQNLAEASFRLPCLLGGNVFHSTVGGSATLRFVGLPTGAVVRSCNGYGQSGPTPGMPTSWGRVKTACR